MSTGLVNPELATTLPLDRIAEICRRHGVSELSVFGLKCEQDAKPDDCRLIASDRIARMVLMPSL
jgi:hypothetical protein